MAFLKILMVPIIVASEISCIFDVYNWEIDNLSTTGSQNYCKRELLEHLQDKESRSNFQSRDRKANSNKQLATKFWTFVLTRCRTISYWYRLSLFKGFGDKWINNVMIAAVLRKYDTLYLKCLLWFIIFA